MLLETPGVKQRAPACEAPALDTCRHPRTGEEQAERVRAHRTDSGDSEVDVLLL